MIYATKIRMKPGCQYHDDLTEIDSIFLEGDGYYRFCKKADVHDMVKWRPGSVKVNLYPYANVIDAVSAYGEKYVRSQPNATNSDNLLKLPRV